MAHIIDTQLDDERFAINQLFRPFLSFFRQMINAAWSAAGQDIGLYVVAHVGTTVQSDAIAMAAYAKFVKLMRNTQTNS